ncbi:MAG: hypothetical protein J7J27_00620 [Euryarchaeota archaeon]|nr:hypothetical protein [Euryarchaeota archaeon]
MPLEAMFMDLRPPVKGKKCNDLTSYDESLAKRAIETAKRALQFVELGPPIIRRGPRGEASVEIPLMYDGYALDRIHYDPRSGQVIPKGAPPHVFGVEVDSKEISKRASNIISQLRVIEAVEYRGPEQAWAVPIAYGVFLIAHIKVSKDGSEIIPDYKLTEEVRRNVI